MTKKEKDIREMLNLLDGLIRTCELNDNTTDIGEYRAKRHHYQIELEKIESAKGQIDRTSSGTSPDEIDGRLSGVAL